MGNESGSFSLFLYLLLKKSNLSRSRVDTYSVLDSKY
jgi:hypothetical protein